MRVSELFEEKDDPYKVMELNKNLDEIVKTLESRCSSMISAYRKTGIVLLRGIRELKYSGSPTVATARIRPDRVPLQMPLNNHNLISDAMSELGLPSRRDSLFCTTDEQIAFVWGKIYILFVEDGWQGLVFNNIPTDSYAYNTLETKSTEILNTDTDQADKIEMMKKVIVSLKPRKFSTAAGLANVLEEKFADILIKGGNFYALKANAEDTTRILLRLGINHLKNAPMKNREAIQRELTTTELKWD